jgi:hypothetical protein
VFVHLNFTSILFCLSILIFHPFLFCSSILIFIHLYCSSIFSIHDYVSSIFFIHNYHSSMYTWQNIPPHHDIFYAMCQGIFFNILLMLVKDSRIDSFLLTYSCSCSHAHHLASAYGLQHPQQFQCKFELHKQFMEK